MDWFLYTIGVLWLATGAGLILYTENCRRLLIGWFSNIHTIIPGLAAVALGFLLAVSAAWSRHFWFVVLLGVLGMLKGAFFLFNPRNAAGELKNWFLHRASDHTYRLSGIFMLLAGAAVFFFA